MFAHSLISLVFLPLLCASICLSVCLSVLMSVGSCSPELSLGYVYDSSLPEPRVDDLVALQCVEVNIEPLLYTAAFLDLSPHMLEKLVRRGNLLVDEFLLFQACVRWARTRLWRRGEAHTDRVAIRAELCGGPGAKKEEGKKQDLPVNILSYIRFPAMQSVEIERVARTGLLAPSEMERVWTWKYTSGRQVWLQRSSGYAPYHPILLFWVFHNVQLLASTWHMFVSLCICFHIFSHFLSHPLVYLFTCLCYSSRKATSSLYPRRKWTLSSLET